jgi:hypothetical protein
MDRDSEPEALGHPKPHLPCVRALKR